MLNVDRRAFLATFSAGSLATMSSEDKAEALEHYMLDRLHKSTANPAEALVQEAQQAQEAKQPRGTGRVLLPVREPLKPLPKNPTFLDFFQLRFGPSQNHVLQSANHALKTGQPERTVMACLLHDTVQQFIKADHGYFGAQLYAPYVDERVSWGIKYHQCLRFYPDDSVGYVYPHELYDRIFGEDYIPPEYIKKDYEFAKNHAWYMEARLVTLNDLYAFEEGVTLTVDPFVDIIGRNFKNPPEGLGYDNSPSAHMWRTLENPDKPL
jgi:hypothetical protein